MIGLVSIAPLVVIAEWIIALRLSRRLRLALIRSRPPGVEPPLVSHGRRASLVLTLGGALAASVGGLMALGFAVAVATGELQPTDLGPAIAGGVLLGLTPLVGGTAVFAWGLKRLNEADH